MLQAPVFDGLSFDPFPFQQDGLAAPEVDIGGREVIQALVVAPVVVVLDEGAELGFEITGQIIVLQQDPVLEGLVPALDLALGLGMGRCATDMLHALIIEPFGQVAGDIAGSVVGQAMSRRLLKFNGGSVDDYATLSTPTLSPSC